MGGKGKFQHSDTSIRRNGGDSEGISADGHLSGGEKKRKGEGEVEEEVGGED